MERNVIQLTALILVLAVCLSACGLGTADPTTNNTVPSTSPTSDQPETTIGEHEHTWDDGVCTLCEEVCAHTWEGGRCAVCRLRCAHESHDPQTLECGTCGRKMNHSYEYTDYVNGTCSMCDDTTMFIWEFGKIDTSLKEACTNQGTIETVTYTTHAYAIEAATGEDDITLEKTMYVYLPYGYSADENYNVLYLMHGGGENEGYWFGVGDYEPDWFEKYQATNCVVNMLDNMIDKGLIDPIIVVSVSFYSEVEGYAIDQLNFPAHFYKEFKNDIMPTIAQMYSTYAEGTTPEDLIAARDHVGYAGFSMGSMTGFQSIMQNSLDYVSWIGNYSAGYGADETRDSNEKGLNALIDKLNNEYKDYKINYWFNGDGTMDLAHDGHVATYNTMLSELPDRFVDGENCIFIDIPGGGHTYPAWEVDLYNTLLVFFK